MPSYDFVCQDCDAPYEVRLSMSAYDRGEGRVCPKCGSKNVERTFTAVNVIAGGSSGGSWSGSDAASSCGPSGFT
ncbi:MAG: zinc ribbon domain-containing protein [Gemmatimonadota bacterium]